MKLENSGNPQMFRTHNITRYGEDGTAPTRHQRFYTVGTEWYFHTREGIEQGPYKDLLAAKEGLKLFLRRCGIVQLVR